MSQNVFMVDLHHAGGEDEEVNRLIDEIPTDTKRIFLLGDIFHYWVNDDSFIQERYTPFLSRLKRLAGQGIKLFFIEGNRDFLAVPYLEEEPWIDVLPNPSLFDLHGRAIYIGHGDELCLDDWQYQLFKTVIRSTPVKYLANHLPSKIKVSVVKNMERASKSFIAGKKKESLRVPERVYKSWVDSGIDAIVHGHLHETYQRQITSNGRVCQVFCFGWKNGKRNIIHFDGQIVVKKFQFMIHLFQPKQVYYPFYSFFDQGSTMSLRYEIIEILERDARTSHDDIAAMTGQPVETVQAEISQMENEGMILGYKTIINPEKSKEDVVSCLVELSVQPERGHGFEHIAERIYRFPEVKSVFLVSGRYDFLILVEGNSMRAVADFIADKLAVIPNIRSQSSHFLLKKYKEMGAVLMDTPSVERIPVSP